MLEQSDRNDKFDAVEEIIFEPRAAGEKLDEDSADEDNGSGLKRIIYLEGNCELVPKQCYEAVFKVGRISNQKIIKLMTVNLCQNMKNHKMGKIIHNF